MSRIEELHVQLRRAMQAGDDTSAEVIATELAELEGDPIEDDRMPEPIPTWGLEA